MARLREMHKRVAPRRRVARGGAVCTMRAWYCLRGVVLRLVLRYQIGPIPNGGMEIFRNGPFGMGIGSCFAIPPNKLYF